MTVNAKVDIRALPSPDEGPDLINRAYTPPHNQLEQSILTVWQEILQLDRIDVEDSFFDLGGHSLLLARLQSRLQEVLHKEIPIIHLFQYTTVRAQAIYLEFEEDTKIQVMQQNTDWARQRKEASRRQWSKSQAHRSNRSEDNHVASDSEDTPWKN